uniref:Transmembrane 7 superfamily member 3 n=1 Tax=Neogobius melanostomus TaxID=47308 RepID=A0A8C6U719_9GOBI
MQKAVIVHHVQTACKNAHSSVKCYLQMQLLIIVQSCVSRKVSVKKTTAYSNSLHESQRKLATVHSFAIIVNLSSLTIILPGNMHPVPGACNVNFDLDIDPNIYIHYNLYETTIRFALANLGYGRGELPPACSASSAQDSHWRLEYDVFQFFLPENDLSERSLFRALQAVADTEGMVSNGNKLQTLSSADQTVAVFSSIPGQGVIYSVIVRDPLLNTSASYVPVHTYACSFSSSLDGCYTLGKISTKVFFTISGLAGLFICFLGHRFFKCELFCMGFSFSAFFFFVLISRTTDLDYDLRLALCALIGVMGGVALVMGWWRFGSVMACVIVVGLMMGFLIASTVLFTPLGDLDIFRHSDAVFWVTFCSIMITVPLVFIRWPREGNITTCGVVGAYAVVLGVNAYIYTSLSYITSAFTDVPFQGIDYILLTVWVVLGVSGIILQLLRERERPFFPPSPYLMWLQERERRKTNVLDPSHHFPPLPNRFLSRLRQLTRRSEPAGEHTPLLL